MIRFQAYDIINDQWVEGKLISVSMDVQGEVREFYADNVEVTPSTMDEIRVFDENGQFIESFCNVHHMYQMLNRRYINLQRKRKRELQKAYRRGFFAVIVILAIIFILINVQK